MFARAFRMMAGPTGFQQERPAAFQAQEGDTGILNVKWSSWIDLALAPIHFSQTAWTKLGVGVRGHGSRFKLAEQMQASVEHMHGEVVSAAASCKLHLGEPRSDAWNVVPAQPKTARMINFS